MKHIFFLSFKRCVLLYEERKELKLDFLWYRQLPSLQLQKATRQYQKWVRVNVVVILFLNQDITIVVLYFGCDELFKPFEHTHQLLLIRSAIEQWLDICVPWHEVGSELLNWFVSMFQAIFSNLRKKIQNPKLELVLEYCVYCPQVWLVVKRQTCWWKRSSFQRGKRLQFFGQCEVWNVLWLKRTHTTSLLLGKFPNTTTPFSLFVHHFYFLLFPLNLHLIFRREY